MTQALNNLCVSPAPMPLLSCDIGIIVCPYNCVTFISTVHHFHCHMAVTWVTFHNKCLLCFFCSWFSKTENVNWKPVTLQVQIMFFTSHVVLQCWLLKHFVFLATQDFLHKAIQHTSLADLKAFIRCGTEIDNTDFLFAQNQEMCKKSQCVSTMKKCCRTCIVFSPWLASTMACRHHTRAVFVWLLLSLQGPPNCIWPTIFSCVFGSCMSRASRVSRDNNMFQQCFKRQQEFQDHVSRVTNWARLNLNPPRECVLNSWVGTLVLLVTFALTTCVFDAHFLILATKILRLKHFRQIWSPVLQVVTVTFVSCDW